MTNGAYNMYPNYQQKGEMWVSGLGHSSYPVSRPELTPEQRQGVQARLNAYFNPGADVEVVEVTSPSDAS